MQRPAFIFAVIFATLHSPLATVFPAEGAAFPADATSEAPQGPVVLGLELSEAKQTRDRAELPDLYEPDPANPGLWKSTAGVYQAPLDKHAWLKFPAAKGRYYIEYRDDREKPETERTYGPFEGDPFERFGLEEKMAARLANDALATDDTYRIELMLRHGDRHLHARAFRLMQAALGDDVETPTRAGYVATFRGFLEEYAEPIAEQETSMADAAKLSERLAIVDKLIDDFTLEFARQEYSDPDPDVMPTVRDSDWGDVVEGLRFAAVPAARQAKSGEAIDVQLIVENVGDKPIKFSASDLVQGAQLEVVGADGKKVEIRNAWFSGLALIQRYWLDPGERIVLAKTTVVFRPTASDSHVFGQGEAIAGPGNYRVSYKVGLGVNTSWIRQDDGLMHRVSPAKGEWKGWLASAAIPIAVGE